MENTSTTTKTRKRRISVPKVSKAKATDKVDQLLKSVETHVHELRERFAKFDKGTATESLKGFRKQVEDLSHTEFDKVKTLVEKRVATLQKISKKIPKN